MPTFADRIIAFNRSLEFNGALPDGIRIMNPFRENPEAARVSELFYRRFYNDNQPRSLILGINPGRFGAGLTGIPFTDPKRLVEQCGIPYTGAPAHEPSSVYVYEVIAAYGGMERFYQDIYINSVCPLGFTNLNDKGKEVNYNYYDSRALTEAVYDFIVWNIRQQIALGVRTDRCFCFGSGANYQFLNKLNDKFKFFGSVVPLEHPRFIMQYKAKSKQTYIEGYLSALTDTV